ncbi:MAG: ATP-binding protein, partial [Cyanobacteriota bacterium]
DREYMIKEYRELLKGILKHEIEFRIVLPDNSVRWLLLSPHLITNGQGRRFIAGLAEDITILKDKIHIVEKFAAKKDSVLEILSHDLAGPLGNVQALTDLLSESLEDTENAQVKNIIRIIRESTSRSIHLIRDFVQQEFLESSNSGIVKRRVNLVEKISYSIEQYKEGQDLIQKEMRFTYTSEKCYVYIDENKFMQAINNLLSNAIKFTHDNGVIDVDLSEKDETVLITVKDNGIGIPKRYQDELFDKFTKARREGLRGEPSTGLGMSIIKTIVEWHNGSIWFDSEENVGTSFYIEIPKQ